MMILNQCCILWRPDGNQKDFFHLLNFQPKTQSRWTKKNQDRRLTTHSLRLFWVRVSSRRTFTERDDDSAALPSPQLSERRYGSLDCESASPGFPEALRLRPAAHCALGGCVSNESDVSNFHRPIPSPRIWFPGGHSGHPMVSRLS
jgi:hypothetical protein